MWDIGAIDPIFALSLLLAVGFAAARLANLVRLPKVTGYVAAGAALGPSGIDLIPHDLLEQKLQIFTTIALMLVAFAIGERFELEALQEAKKLLRRVGLGEILGTMVLVTVGVAGVGWLTRLGGPGAGWAQWVSVALICGSIAVATAPAATMMVLRELGAHGPVSRLILSSVVVNNAASLILFGIVAAIARSLLQGNEMGWLEMALPILKAAAALTVGLSVGLITDVLVHRIHRRAEVLVIALTAVFFCGGLATYLGLSPLLAGVAAGFMVVNRDRRDVRVFRALNDFEPPIYGVFFALAGAQFHLEELLEAGWIGATFVLLRMVAKAGGAWAGARSGGMEPDRARILGLGLFSQAGLAIGLAYLVAQDPLLESIRSTVLNVVVASVVINELVGPPLVRWVALRTGEAEPDAPSEHDHPSPVGEVDVVRWSWRKLEAPPRTEGAVIAGLHHPATAEAVTRVAVLLSHHYGAMPVALRVVSHELPSSLWGEDDEPLEVLVHAEREAETMGYELHSEVEPAQDVAEGLLRAIRAHGAKALVLGHPEESRAHAFGRIVDAVAARASCPIVVARFVGTLHTERILVPVTGEEGFVSVLPVVQALAAVAEHQVQVLYLIPPDSGDAALSQAREELTRWLIQANLPGDVDSRAIATDSRVHTIVTEAERTDIVVMATGQQKGLRRTFFGSLAEDVAVRSSRTVLLVHRPLQ